MEQPNPEYSVPRWAQARAPQAAVPVYTKADREHSRRAEAGGRDRAADLLAALALPLLVLGLVVSRLSLGIAGRRRRDKQRGNRSHDAPK